MQELHESGPFNWELAAQAITVRIRWFGLCVGYALVNLPASVPHQAILNAILTLGAVYAVFDTYYNAHGKGFLSEWPLFISAMEAVFIGLLCHFENGLQSPFRFYYFLSLLVCAFRYDRGVAYPTFALHTISYLSLGIWRDVPLEDRFSTMVLMPVFMGWVTWGSTSLAGLLKRASDGLTALNTQLQEDQGLLELRIRERTQELQESQALLVQQEKQAAFGLLAAGIAHEVGNPLAAISSLVQLLNRRDIDQHTREKLQLVDDQLRRIQRTLRELVDFSRPTNLTDSRCDIHDVIGNALSIAKYYKRKKGKRIVTRFVTDLPPLNTVRDQLVQVFLNLILNAMDATEEGGTITIVTRLKSGTLQVDVSDDGRGIAAEDLDRIFQPYFTTKDTGTGLGLFVCRNLVEQKLGGTMELVAGKPGGTTFRVTLHNGELAGLPDREPPKAAPDVQSIDITESSPREASIS